MRLQAATRRSGNSTATGGWWQLLLDQMLPWRTLQHIATWLLCKCRARRRVEQLPAARQRCSGPPAGAGRAVRRRLPPTLDRHTIPHT